MLQEGAEVELRLTDRPRADGNVASETPATRDVDPLEVAVGKFIYEGDVKAAIEDRALAHLQAVIIAKVRRGEAFPFSWKDDMSTGGGRTTVYLHSHSSIVFKFSGGRTPQLNRAWLHALNETANSGRGLYLVPEPQSPSSPPEPRSEMIFKEVPIE